MRGTDPRVVLGLHRSGHQRRLLTAALDRGVTALDTSSNYLGHRSHSTLARIASDLLPRFEISTKVGYFSQAGKAAHSLEPARLYAAVERAARELGREPDLVFLHNPERSLTARSRETLERACAALVDAAEKGLCGDWGIASWNPAPLLELVTPTTPKPSVLMVRAGLLVGARTLDATEALRRRWDLDPGAVHGMSPFGGSSRGPVWERFDPRVFLRDGGQYTRAQAAFRTAYRLPRVGSIAVGTGDPVHLDQLLAVLNAEVDEEVVRGYRTLLRDRTRTQSA
ncbi:hypothetical protein C0Q64_16090 [Streptomyces albidoflavus]|uniref:aldo/keto reductase n=1 Tax=Streptomyces albidoflavus TaxID=1886 RepID=UPI00101E4889|nr:aldo/keto reductase [Streptomyces albidoflavus]RZD99322.1 hypothetical protein C0Q64_16090 [Streptomyces albidoflavus]RZE00994.1 hypothetical protein C0Q65_16375 [Streptomyces albidoflavus]